MKRAKAARVFFPARLIQAYLVMKLHECAVATIRGLADLMRWERPTEQPLGILSTHVDTAVAHGRAEVFMPVRAMERMALRGKETRPGNAGKLVIFCIGKEI